MCCTPRTQSTPWTPCARDMRFRASPRLLPLSRGSPVAPINGLSIISGAWATLLRYLQACGTNLPKTPIKWSGVFGQMILTGPCGPRSSPKSSTPWATRWWMSAGFLMACRISAVLSVHGRKKRWKYLPVCPFRLTGQPAGDNATSRGLSPRLLP